MWKFVPVTDHSLTLTVCACVISVSKIANDATGAALDCDGSGGDVGGAVVERLCGRRRTVMVVAVM